MHKIRALGSFAAAAVVLTLINPGARADPASHRAAAERYLEVTNVPARLKSLMEQVRETQLAALGKWYVPADTRGPAQTYITEASRLVAEELSWNRLKEEFVEAYVSVYTEEELNGLIGFYRSPLGEKYLSKRGQLVSSGLQITERHLQNLLPQLESLSQDLEREQARIRNTPADRR